MYIGWVNSAGSFFGNVPDFLGWTSADSPFPPPPYIIAVSMGMPIDSISNLNYIQFSGPSPASTTFGIKALGLSPAAGNITVTIPSDFEVKNTVGVWSTGSFTIPYTSGQVNTAEIYEVRLKAGLSPSSYSQNVVLSGANAPSFNLAVSGTVTAASQFVITVKTDNPGTSANNQFTLPLRSPLTYNFIIDWGDGTTTNQTTNVSPTHTYPSIGTYQIKISGIFPSIYFNNGGDRRKLTRIDNWGNIVWRDLRFAFYGCSNFNLFATDAPILNSLTVTSLEWLFYGCTAFNANIDNWNVSNITSLFYVFGECSIFNSDLNSWNIGNVTTLELTFYRCFAFNKPLSNWNTSKVTTLSQTFRQCTIFNQPLNTWDVSKVTTLFYTFGSCTAFNQNLNSWNTALVTDMQWTFILCTNFNGDITSWNVGKCVNFVATFADAPNFNQNINNWDVKKGASFFRMFLNSTGFNQPLNNWQPLQATDFQEFMSGKTAANYLATYLDGIYNSWSLLVLKPNVVANFGTIKYTAAGAAGKAILVGPPNNWTIADGGI